jgi:aminoglycoside phosphotransferase (APT) family kinase protein
VDVLADPEGNEFCLLARGRGVCSMSDDDDIEATRTVAVKTAESLAWTGVRHIGIGVEFAVFAADDAHGVAWALRIPRRLDYRTPNNPGVSATALQHQEKELAAWAADNGIPAARPQRLVSVGQTPVLVTQLCADDGSPVEGRALGAILARIHAAPPPKVALVAQRSLTVPQLIPYRLHERYAALRQRFGDLPQLPDNHALADRLRAGQTTEALTHLDIRRQNILTVAGTPTALIDWANALLADPLLEIARIVEYAALAENGLTLVDILQGYADAGGTLDIGSARWNVFRLDTAVMLAVVFLCVAPDQQRMDMFLGRIRNLLAEL